MTDERTGSDYVLDALAAEGVDRLFGLIGEGNADLLDSTHEHDLPFHYARHEQAAVSMADGYARTTGTVGVCTLTHGPGLTNGATGIAIADRDDVPLVVLVGDTDSEGRETSLQYLEHLDFTEPISVAGMRAETPGRLPEILRRAFDTARTRSGPVVVELPGDVQSAAAPEDPYRPVERFVALVGESATLRGFNTTHMAPLVLGGFHQQVFEATDTELIYLPGVAEKLFEAYPDRANDAIEQGHLTLRTREQLPYGLALFDERVGIGGYDDRTGLLEVFVDTDSPIAREWAERVFASVRIDSDPVGGPHE